VRSNERHALELDPGLAEAHRAIATVLEQKKDLGGAIEHYRAAVAIDPDNAQARERLAALLAHGKGRR